MDSFMMKKDLERIFSDIVSIEIIDGDSPEYGPIKRPFPFCSVLVTNKEVCGGYSTTEMIVCDYQSKFSYSLPKTHTEEKGD